MAAPEPIEPDDKNWTWVIERRCEECGFDAPAFDVSTMADAILANAARWVAVCGRADVAERPAPRVWSALEYACHVRDVFRLYDYRLGLMLSEDGPTYPNWDQDETAVAERYDLADPAVVAAELVAAAEKLAERYRQPIDWTRTGFRSDGARFTIDSFSRYLMHDPNHHLVDVNY